jgi:hypothetical protein
VLVFPSLLVFLDGIAINLYIPLLYIHLVSAFVFISIDLLLLSEKNKAGSTPALFKTI